MIKIYYFFNLSNLSIDIKNNDTVAEPITALNAIPLIWNKFPNIIIPKICIINPIIEPLKTYLLFSMARNFDV